MDMRAFKNARNFSRHFFSLLLSIRVIIVCIIILIMIGALVFAVEGFDEGKHSFWLALYLSLITTLTIGYDDLTPDGPFGMGTAVVLGALGIILMGIIVGAAIKALERSVT